MNVTVDTVLERPADPKKPTVVLNTYDMIDKIQKAYEEKTLQMFTAELGTTPSYAGPCAVGVCIPEDTRATLDTGKFGYSVSSLVQSEVFVFPNVVAEKMFSHLQSLHDTATVTTYEDRKEESIQKFGTFLGVMKDMIASGDLM